MTEKPRQVEGPDLATLPCPTCSKVGTLELRQRLIARPIGTWSLAGSQLKTSAAWAWRIVCTAEGCDFVKSPKENP